MKTTTKHKAYIYCTQCHLDMLKGNETYADNYSLIQALERIDKLEDNIVKEDVAGWGNPYLDMLAEELE